MERVKSLADALKGNGKLMTIEQSLRLAVKESVDRDRLVAGIVRALRAAEAKCGRRKRRERKPADGGQS